MITSAVVEFVRRRMPAEDILLRRHVAVVEDTVAVVAGTLLPEPVLLDHQPYSWFEVDHRQAPTMDMKRSLDARMRIAVVKFVVVVADAVRRHLDVVADEIHSAAGVKGRALAVAVDTVAEAVADGALRCRCRLGTPCQCQPRRWYRCSLRSSSF